MLKNFHSSAISNVLQLMHWLLIMRQALDGERTSLTTPAIDFYFYPDLVHLLISCLPRYPAAELNVL